MTDSYYRAIVKSGVSAYGQRVARYVGDVLAEEVGVGVVVDHRALHGLEGRAEQVVVVVVACGHRASQVRSARCQDSFRRRDVSSRETSCQPKLRLRQRSGEDSADSSELKRKLSSRLQGRAFERLSPEV